MALNFGIAYSKVTHAFAVVILAAAGFMMTDAGQALIHQYPKLSGLAVGLSLLATLYRNPSVPPVSK